MGAHSCNTGFNTLGSILGDGAGTTAWMALGSSEKARAHTKGNKNYQMPWPMVEDDIIKTQRSEIRGCKGDTKKKCANKRSTNIKITQWCYLL